MKARLCEAGIEFAKIHDCVALLDQAIVVEPGWKRFREDMAYLSGFAVMFRYPGESADKAMASDARQRCKRFRIAARAALELDVK